MLWMFVLEDNSVDLFFWVMAGPLLQGKSLGAESSGRSGDQDWQRKGWVHEGCCTDAGGVCQACGWWWHHRGYRGTWSAASIHSPCVSLSVWAMEVGGTTLATHMTFRLDLALNMALMLFTRDAIAQSCRCIRGASYTGHSEEWELANYWG